MNQCRYCKAPTQNPSFCNHSCAARFHNKTPGRKHGPAPDLTCRSRINAAKRKPRRPSRPLWQKRLLSREAFQHSKAIHHYCVEVKDRDVVKQFYLDCPSGYEVDHIVPFFAGGGHTPPNLQYLTPEQNKEKYKNDLQLYGLTWLS